MTEPLFLPPVIGHRGAAALAPENTLAALRAAAAAGVAMVEFDATLTADGVPIVLHDETLDRTTNGSGALDDIPAAVIAGLDAGAWFDARFAGEPVPTLEAVLITAADLGLAVNVEIKPCPGRDAETAAAVLATTRAVWPGGRSGDRPVPLVSSFSRTALRVAADTVPDWPRGYLIWDRPDDWAAFADAIGATTLNISPARSTAEEMAGYLANGRPVAAFTVNDPAIAQRLWADGVGAVITDDPGLMLTARAAYAQ